MGEGNNVRGDCRFGKDLLGPAFKSSGRRPNVLVYSRPELVQSS